MSTISKALSGILFNGADLDLTAASWKSKVSAIYGFNAAGNGYTVFKPSSNFNSLTKLVQDGAYIIAATTPGFELPGATLAVVPVVQPAVADRFLTTAAQGTQNDAGAMTAAVSTGSVPGYRYVEVTVSSTDPADSRILVIFPFDGRALSAYVGDQVRLGCNNTEVGSDNFIFVVNSRGQVLLTRFTSPA